MLNLEYQWFLVNAQKNNINSQIKLRSGSIIQCVIEVCLGTQIFSHSECVAVPIRALNFDSVTV